MSWLRKDVQLLSNTMEEEFYEALAQAAEPADTGAVHHGQRLKASEEGSQAHGMALHRQGRVAGGGWGEAWRKAEDLQEVA